MPVWESGKGLERKPLFRQLQSIPTDGWISPLQPSPCHELKNIRILKLWKNHRSASPITIYFKDLTCYDYWNLFVVWVIGYYSFSLPTTGNLKMSSSPWGAISISLVRSFPPKWHRILFSPSKRGLAERSYTNPLYPM